MYPIEAFVLNVHEGVCDQLAWSPLDCGKLWLGCFYVCPYVCLFVCLSVYLSVCMSLRLSVIVRLINLSLSIYRFNLCVRTSVCMYRSVYLCIFSIYLSIYRPIYLYSCMYVFLCGCLKIVLVCSCISGEVEFHICAIVHRR